MNFGKFIITGFQGTKIPLKLKTLILKHDIAGVILFTRNFESPDQLEELCLGLHELKKRVSDNPLIISVDYEGGFVVRFRRELSRLPSAFSQSLFNKPSLTRTLYHFNAYTLGSMRINCNFAPVLDISSSERSFIGIRSYSKDPAGVTRFARQAMLGIQGAGLIPCGKHYPGIGRASADSHFIMPSIRGGIRDFLEKDLRPFKSLIDEGLRMIMTSHCSYPDMDKKKIPATFSSVINTGILRERLGFMGVLISDDLCMKALSGWDLNRSALSAFNSGVDLLMICHELGKIEEVIRYMDNSARGNISLQKRSAESEGRMAGLFSYYVGLRQQKSKPETGSQKIDVICGNMAKKSVVIFKKGHFNIKRNDKIAVCMSSSFSANSAEDEPVTVSFIKKFTAVFTNARLLQMDEIPGEAEKLIFITGNISSDADQQTFVHGLHKKGRKIDLAVCVKNSTDAVYLKKYSGEIILTHGFQSYNMEALIGFLS